MPNDPQTLLKRRAIRIGTISEFALPQMPSLPDRIRSNYPELREYERQMAAWVQNLNTALVQALTRGKAPEGTATEVEANTQFKGSDTIVFRQDDSGVWAADYVGGHPESQPGPAGPPGESIVGPPGLSVTGDPGPPGADGADGADGISVVDAYIDGSGHLIIVLSDASEIDAGPVQPTGATVSAECDPDNPGNILLTFEGFTYS